MAVDRNDSKTRDTLLESSATHYWKKQVATEEMKTWGTSAVINSGDTYYEYIIEIKLYGRDFEFNNPIVTERQYFKHVLTGTAGFKYYDEKD